MARLSEVPERDPARAPADVVAELRQVLAKHAPKVGGAPRAPIPTGIPLIDEALQGGLPRGKLVEVTGAGGPMAVALAALAGANRHKHLAAFVDVPDALDAAAARDQGVDLRRLLWARPRSAEDALRVVDLVVALDGFALVVLYLVGTPAPRRMDHAWLRLQQRCERSGTALLIVADRALAGPCAVTTLALRPGPASWTRAPGGRAVLTGRALHVEVVRSKLGTLGAGGALYLPKAGPR